jgi:NO-binding membrane sensor protein with MHYT domain
LGTTLRRLILFLLLFGLLGTTGELVLIEHFEDWRQKLPLVAMALGCVVATMALLRPSRRTLRVLQSTMVVFVAAGLLGLYYHYTGNAEFELEMRPSMEGFELVWESLKGATPALAPGTLVQFGLLGLLHTFKHPLLEAAE